MQLDLHLLHLEGLGFEWEKNAPCLQQLDKAVKRTASGIHGCKTKTVMQV